MTPNKDIEEQVGLLRVGLGLDDEDSEVAKNILQIILDQQRQEIIEELEGMYYKPEAPEELKIDSHQVFFNQALELAISKIKEME